MKTIIFVGFIFAWILIGISGIANCKENCVNGEMIYFFCFVPFIPLLAKILL